MSLALFEFHIGQSFLRRHFLTVCGSNSPSLLLVILRGLFSGYIVHNFEEIIYLVACFMGITSSKAATCFSCVFLFWEILSLALTNLSRFKHVLDTLIAISINLP
jgi:hypothetical protein